MATVTNNNIQKECKEASSRIADISKVISGRIVGRKAKIISNFNGQCVGHSKPSLKDKTITIKSILIDSRECYLWDGNYNHYFIPIGEVEFLDD